MKAAKNEWDLFFIVGAITSFKCIITNYFRETILKYAKVQKLIFIY